MLLLWSACGPGAAAPVSEAPAAGSPGVLKVVTTVSPITSIVENIGGRRIQLEGIVPEGVNSHTFAPAPSVAVVISQADLVVLNGLFLEEPTLAMAEANKDPGSEVLSLGDRTITEDQWRYDRSFPQDEGVPNPHLWPDPILALAYAELVEGWLARLDPDNAGYYSDNLDEFRRRIELLDQAIKTAVSTIPEANRKLLTYHDSWPYFADRYGMGGNRRGPGRPTFLSHRCVRSPGSSTRSGSRACRRCSGPRCFPATSWSRSPGREAPTLSTSSGTTTCREGRGTPAIATWA